VKKDKEIYLISLGCAKNLVDSEHILGILEEKGFHLANDLEEAKIAIINTCGFVQSAVEETIDTILEVISLKKQGIVKKIIVTGCFVQRYGYKLKREMPEVDAWLGTGEFFRIAELIEGLEQHGSELFHIGRPAYLTDHSTPKIQTTPFYSAYLKIAEGCSHSCSFCIIPTLRGPYRSRNMESLIIEAERMAENGVKEVNLIAQDTTFYGKDLGEEHCLEDLLERLTALNKFRWIRLLYCHPERISERLLDLMDSEEAICPYIDVPFQHVNEKILKAMNRFSSRLKPWELIEKLRSRRRRISIRTTLMVGFPGETDEIFRELCEFVKTSKFDHMGAFVFSKEKGAPAARLEQTVNIIEAQERLKILMKLQEEISKGINRRLVGEIVPVLIEGVSPETDLLLKGRTAAMAPEVDGQVLINKGQGEIGEIMPVYIKEAHAHDLVGEIVV